MPRLLGASLDRVHSTIGSYFQILQYFTAVRSSPATPRLTCSKSTKMPVQPHLLAAAPAMPDACNLLSRDAWDSSQLLLECLRTWLTALRGLQHVLHAKPADTHAFFLTPAFSCRVQGVQKVSKYYHPFGTYHFILGAEIRTPPGSTTARSCSGVQTVLPRYMSLSSTRIA